MYAIIFGTKPVRIIMANCLVELQAWVQDKNVGKDKAD